MELTAKSFTEKVEQSGRPALVEFWASWCLPCKQIEGVLAQLAEKYKEKCGVYKINVDRNPSMSQKFGIQGLPTFISFANGKEMERKTASQPESEIDAMIQRVISSETVSEEEQQIIEERLRDLGYL